MENLFGYLERNTIGIAVFLLILLSLLFIIRSVAYTFGLGRYKRDPRVATPREQSSVATPFEQPSIRYIFAELAVKIINDFRHLLALVIVGIFGLSLAYGLYAAEDFDNRIDTLQAIVAVFGGIVGSIIGYYFGESAAKAPMINDSPGIDDGGDVTQDDEDNSDTSGTEEVAPVRVRSPPSRPTSDNNQNSSSDTENRNE